MWQRQERTAYFQAEKNIESAHLYTCYVCIHTHTFIHTHSSTHAKSKAYTRAQQQQTLLYACMYLWVTMAALMAQVDSSSCFCSCCCCGCYRCCRRWRRCFYFSSMPCLRRRCCSCCFVVSYGCLDLKKYGELHTRIHKHIQTSTHEGKNSTDYSAMIFASSTIHRRCCSLVVNFISQIQFY